MATTSIWAVKGWLGKVVLYIENPEKTENPQFYRQKDMTDAQTQNLSDVIDYAARSDKTTAALDSESVPILRQLVSGINCLPATARDEMLAVKKRFGKEDGVVAYHGYQSFAPGEATPELAHEIGVKLARKLWGEKYQVLVSTHLDKENHLHSHFVVNTVSFVDGIRYHRTGKDYYEMRTVSDELCREYGLSVVEKPQLGKSKHYGEWRAEQEQRPTWRGLIRSEIDELIRESVSEKQFYYLLRQKGYAVKFGKDISVRPPGKERFVRLARNFGAAYTEHSQQANANNNIEAQSTDKNNYSGLNSLRYRMSLGNENNDSSLDSLSQKTKVTIGVPIYFYFKLNTAKLVDKTQLVNLDEIAKIAKEQNLTIHISGAADKATGSDKRNRHLSIERAKYICKQLIKRGVDKDAMKATSLGGIEQFLPKEANRFGVVLLTQ